VKAVKNTLGKNYKDNYSPELLSKIVLMELLTTLEQMEVSVQVENKSIKSHQRIVPLVKFIDFICAEKLDYEIIAPTGLVLASSTVNCWKSKEWISYYCPSFEDRGIVTVHLDMNKRTLAFTVNSAKYRRCHYVTYKTLSSSIIRLSWSLSNPISSKI
jgi:hypothetical protein